VIHPTILVSVQRNHTQTRTRIISQLDKVHLLGLVEDVGEVALTAVLAVVHSGHEDTGTALEYG
jgi:hypothetical protein